MMNFTLTVAVLLVSLPGSLSSSYKSRISNSPDSADNPLQVDSADFDFASFKKVFARTYSEGGKEHTSREQLFNERMLAIEAHNSHQLSWHMGVNQFTDRTEQELQEYRGYKRHRMPKSMVSSFFESSSSGSSSGVTATKDAKVASASEPEYSRRQVVLCILVGILVVGMIYWVVVQFATSDKPRTESSSTMDGLPFRVTVIVGILGLFLLGLWLWLRSQDALPLHPTTADSPAASPATSPAAASPPRGHCAGQVCMIGKPCCSGFTCGAQGVCMETPENLPESLDWTSRFQSGRKIMDQGACGSCWAVAAAGIIQLQGELNTNRSLEVSPQGMVGCTPNPHECGGQGGCDGATPELALAWATRYGVQDTTAQEYTATNGCPSAFLQSRPAFTIKGYVSLPENRADLVMQALVAAGPLAIAVAAHPWHSYAGGVFTGCSTMEPVIDHAVVLVGYGNVEGPRYGTVVEDGMKYWNIKNSWGSGWGENGFIRLQRNYGPNGGEEPCGWDNDPEKGNACKDPMTGKYPEKQWVCGECGMLSSSSYPVGTQLGSGVGPLPTAASRTSSVGESKQPAGSISIGGQVVDNQWCKSLCQRFAMNELTKAFDGADFGDHPTKCLQSCDTIVPVKA